jgi:dihydroorotase
MLVLFKKATLLLPNHSLNGKVKDVLIENGIIKAVSSKIIAPKKCLIIETKNLFISFGWVDTFATLNDPGTEHKEDIYSGLQAALQGGFTNIFTLPNTLPSVDNKSLIYYQINKNTEAIIKLHPLGAATKKTEGNNLAEIYDMHYAGAVATSDGLKTIQSSALFVKILQYVKSINGIVIQSAADESLSKIGLMNEGEWSTKLGMPGIPSVAEEIQIQKDISLLKYANSKLHISGVSTAAGLALIKNAKKEGLQITCSVAWHNLVFDESELCEYNSTFKVQPPLRSSADKKACWKYLADGTIDCIASFHQPQDWDSKHVEFEYAENGMATLETILHGLLKVSSPEIFIKALSTNARTIFDLEQPVFEINKPACITVFSTSETVTYQEIKKTKGMNSPYCDENLMGKIIAVINNGETKIF